MSSLGPRISTHGVGAVGTQGCNSASSPPHSNKNVNIYIYIYIYILTHVFYSRLQRRERKKGRGVASHGPALESSASCRCFKLRVTASRTSWVVFRSWGMSSTGSKPKLIRTPATCMTCCNSRSASVARSAAIISTRMQAFFSSADRSYHQKDAGHAPAPLPKLPRATPDSFPASRKGSCVHPTSDQGLYAIRTRS
jgi:hypothetical protein